jgi:hypothetical protein
MRHVSSAPVETTVNPFDPILEDLAVATGQYEGLRQNLDSLQRELWRADAILDEELNPEVPLDQQPEALARAALTASVIQARMYPLERQQSELRWEHRYSRYIEFIGRKVLVESVDDIRRIGTSDTDGNGLGKWYTRRRGTIKDLDFGPEYGGSITFVPGWRGRRYTAAPLVSRSTVNDPCTPSVRITLL